MEKLSVEKRTEVSKMSTKRFRARLIKAGYDENEVVEMDRGELLSTYAEYLLSPLIPESPEKAEGGVVLLTAGMSAEEWHELELKKQEFEFQKQRQEKEEERRQDEKTGTRVPERETGEGRRVERKRFISAEAAR